MPLQAKNNTTVLNFRFCLILAWERHVEIALNSSFSSVFANVLCKQPSISHSQSLSFCCFLQSCADPCSAHLQHLCSCNCHGMTTQAFDPVLCTKLVVTPTPDMSNEPKNPECVFLFTSTPWTSFSSRLFLSFWEVVPPHIN